MARIIAGVGTSHVPGHRRGPRPRQDATSPYWKPLFDGYEPSKSWMAEVKPDVVILVYNDHANAFNFEIIPTFAHRLRRAISRRPTKAGARGPCPSSRAIRISPRTSRSRWCSTNSTSPSSTRCRSTTG